MSKQQFLGEIKWVKETREQRLVNFLDGEAKLTPGSKQFLGEVKWLGFGYDEGTPVWQPGLSEEEKKSFFPWKQYSDATKNLQGAINAFLATKGCGGVGADGKLGPGTCGAAKLAVSLGGPEGVVGPPSTCKEFGPPPACGAAQLPPPVTPPCDNAKCPPGTECCQESWTEGDLASCTPGTCVKKCPPGYERQETGICKAVATAGGSSGSGPGLLILGAAALGLAFVASKSQLEKIPQRPGRLLENKKRRRRY